MWIPKSAQNNEVNPPTALSSKVEAIFMLKKSPGYGCYLQLNMSIQQIE